MEHQTSKRKLLPIIRTGTTREVYKGVLSKALHARGIDDVIRPT
jgi:hypothetical protein